MAEARIAPERLCRFITAAMERLGLLAEDAATVAELMTQAELQGCDGDGAIRLVSYARRIRAGGVNARPYVRIVKEKAAMALLDGDNGMGHLVMKKAARIAVAKARQCGVAWVGARLSNPAGPASLYARMALAHDMIGLYFAVGNARQRPPWGGLDLLLSANPIAVAVPAGEEAPVVLDMESSDDEQGGGLALVVGLLAGTLNGAAMGSAVIAFDHDDDSVANTGHAILVIDPDAFGEVAAFKARVDALVREQRASRRRPGVDRIWLPGEQGHLRRIENARDGLALPAALRAQLDALARELAIPALDEA